MSRALHLLLDVVVLAFVGYALHELVPAVAARLTFGFDIEWMEGATLVSALRVTQGESIYGAPGPEYIPFIYPPLYAFTVAALSYVFPLGYTLGRAVSLGGTLAGAGALVYAARGAGARWSWAIGAGALFLTTWQEGGTFFDLVRTDGLAIGLLGWALALAARPGRRYQVAGGLLLALAFAAKHHSAMWGLPVAIYLWRRDGLRAGLTFGLAAAVPALIFVGGMQAHTGGTFLTWLVGVPAYHGIVADRLLPWVEVESWWPWKAKTSGAALEVWKALPITTTLGLLAPWWVRQRSAGAYWAVVSLVALVTVSLMRGHTGGFINVLIPMFWAESLWIVLVAGAVIPRWGWTAYLVPLVLAAQLYQGRDDPRRFVPTEADRANGEALLDEIRTLPEPVLLPHAPYYAVLAGKAPTFALICLWDIDHHGNPYERSVRKIDDLLASGHFQSALLPDDKLGHGLLKHFEKARTLRKTIGTRTGWGVRLKQVWLPKEEDAPPPQPPPG